MAKAIIIVVLHEDEIPDPDELIAVYQEALPIGDPRIRGVLGRVATPAEEAEIIEVDSGSLNAGT